MTEQMNVLYKTELCRSWQFGQCKYNERCLFAHGEHELKPMKKPRHNKYKTELCVTFHTFGLCPYAARVSVQSCRFFQNQTFSATSSMNPRSIDRPSIPFRACTRPGCVEHSWKSSSAHMETNATLRTAAKICHMT